MGGSYGSLSGRTIHPKCVDVSVKLESTISLEDEVDLIWTIWDAKLVYPGESLADLLQVDAPDLVLAEGVFGSVDFERLRQAGILLEEALDAYSGDFAEFCSMAEGFAITDELQDRLVDYATGMVIVDRVTVPEPFRGRRFGLLLTTPVLLELGRKRIVVAMPAAFEEEPGSPGRATADLRNVKLWEAFGFERFGGGDTFYLDPALTTLETNLKRFKVESESADAILLQ